MYVSYYNRTSIFTLISASLHGKEALAATSSHDLYI